jgi:hypothetical protein
MDRVSDFVDVVGAKAFLGRNGAGVRGLGGSGEVWLELDHPRRGEQQGRVIWHQRVTGQMEMVLALKELNILPSYF